MSKAKAIGGWVLIALGVLAILTVIAWAFAMSERALDEVATKACADRGGLVSRRGGPQTSSGTGVSTSGNPVVTSTRVDAPYFVTCKNGEVGMFWDDDRTVVFASDPKEEK